MAILKCKMCGGDIELSADKTYGMCDSCGCTMTFPKVSDEQRAAAFNRGNHFRRMGEFDKALAVYERIVAEDETDAEAHWCCALCRFGIEYVEDPATFEWLPTCHRASFDSFMEDVDYLAAVEHSDGVTRRQYQRDAAKIAEVQRGILATSQNEEPFDVFICYKETDESGQRTRDSILAQDIYYRLAEQGRRVFFARITLEDKAGTEFEPYIFAALNSAKVMIAVGTKPEHFSAVWVKNEWYRFLSIMRKDRSRLLLPCYRDMDPYDLPEQLSVLQSYDMAKIGFLQDLIHGVNKVLNANASAPVAKQETVVVHAESSGQTDAFIKRGNMALEDGEWEKADEFFEQALNQNPELADAYLGKFFAERGVPNAEAFVSGWLEAAEDCTAKEKEVASIDEQVHALASKCAVAHFLLQSEIHSHFVGFNNSYFSKVEAREEALAETDELFASDRLLLRAEQFGSAVVSKMKAQLTGGLQKLLDEARQQDEASVVRIQQEFEQFCSEQEAWAAAEVANRKERAYQSAMENRAKEFYLDAISRFDQLGDYKDSAVQAEQCRERWKKMAKKGGLIKALSIGLISLVCVVMLIVVKVIIPSKQYKEAVALMEAGELDNAFDVFQELGNYKDSAQKIEKILLTKEYIILGKYEQNNNTSDGKEDIEWIVLDVEDGKALVISKYALDRRTYNYSRSDVTWETCSLRDWLNDDFLSETFTAEERKLILESKISDRRPSKHNGNPGKETTDKIFVLSYDEFTRYSKARQGCKPTEYAKSKGAYVDKQSGNTVWWLRTIGFLQNCAISADPFGSASTDGLYVDNEARGIRPAMWIDISG